MTGVGAPARTVRMVALTSIANFALISALSTPAIALIPLRISAIAPEAQRNATLGVVLAAGAAAAVLANPVFGVLSDRTRSRWGRRAPWMLGGVALGVLGVIVLAAADRVEAVVAAWVLAQTGFNAALAAVAARFADAVTEARRSAASGVFSASTFLGAVPALALVAVFPAHVTGVAVGVGLVAVVPVVVCAIGTRDTAAGAAAAGSTVSEADARGVRRAFAVLWVQRLLMLSAFGLSTQFTLYLVLDRMRAGEEGATSIVAVSTLIGGASIVVAATLTGILAGRRGNYLPFLLLAAVGLAAAAGLRAVAPDAVVLWVCAAIGGWAMGTFFSADLALALRVIPSGRAGQYLGVLNVTETLPQVAAPLIAPMLLALAGPDPLSGRPDNYAMLFAVACGVALGAAALLPFLRAVARRPAP